MNHFNSLFTITLVLGTILVNTNAFGQSTTNSGITYQAFILCNKSNASLGVDYSDDLLVNAEVEAEFRIVSASGKMLYKEQQKVTTNAYGMINTIVGRGNFTNGIYKNFDAINWGAENTFLEISIITPCKTGGNYVELERKEITYLPFALKAQDISNEQFTSLTETVKELVDKNYITEGEDNQTITNFTLDPVTNFLKISIEKGNTAEVDLSKLTGNGSSIENFVKSGIYIPNDRKIVLKNENNSTLSNLFLSNVVTSVNNFDPDANGNVQLDVVTHAEINDILAADGDTDSTNEIQTIISKDPNNLITTGTDNGALITSVNDADSIIGNEITDATDATLIRTGNGITTPYTLDIAENGITSAEIVDGGIKAEDIANGQISIAKINTEIGNKGKVLTANDDGTASWILAPESVVKATQIVFGSTSNTATSSSNLTWSNTNNKLSVNGTIESTSSIYPDYVFENYYTNKPSKMNLNYRFKTLNEVEAFIKANGHLPGITSYGDYLINNKKVDLTKTSINNLEKIEELFLYIIELKKENETLKNDIRKIKALLTQKQ